ncbi:hypothetical protein GGTG_05877 [Gaeumannomyces tritici R3-111a-1]|uniref:Uncharacterized protein n=1 Tax=Gaeumannomyces tritici (strain R3-111a-1) TaxID=644352 RepID=J3NX70_GAET3|nr:hypothetical protein GGTG_05877 [Gaeumannomyces tritici R3-111a-1]EJT75952.1 hypothetical protein GGTG_05877 [Gaeumannomyces tritici R3-111a-1]
MGRSKKGKKGKPSAPKTDDHTPQPSQAAVPARPGGPENMATTGPSGGTAPSTSSTPKREPATAPSTSAPQLVVAPSTLAPQPVTAPSTSALQPPAPSAFALQPPASSTSALKLPASSSFVFKPPALSVAGTPPTGLAPPLGMSSTQFRPPVFNYVPPGARSASFGPTSSVSQAPPPKVPTLFGAPSMNGSTSRHVEDLEKLLRADTTIVDDFSKPDPDGSCYRAITLQHTPSHASGIATCAAGNRCAWSSRNSVGTASSAAVGEAFALINRQAIKDAYRICVLRGGGNSWNAGRCFYHITCFSHMMKTELLFLDRIPFKLDTQAAAHWEDPGARPWGFMIQQWYDLKGMISMKEAIRYIQAVETYREAKRNAGRAWADWQAKNHNSDIFSRSFPPPVFTQKKPKQRDFDFNSSNLVDLYQLLNSPYRDWVDMRY